ncbi:hypothetical protein XENTR_v10021093 [Xenopus tropicalis]|nr:hypothetical protein XENTR_v10021093 [Xenopus tropicalis]
MSKLPPVVLNVGEYYLNGFCSSPSSLFKTWGSFFPVTPVVWSPQFTGDNHEHAASLISLTIHSSLACSTKGSVIHCYF